MEMKFGTAGSKPPRLGAKLPWAGIALLILVIVVLLSSSAFVVVNPGERGIVLYLGKMQPGELMPGPHFKIPLVEKVIPMNVQVEKYESTESAASGDLQDVSTKVALNYSIDPKKVGWVYQNVGNERILLSKIIAPAVSNAVKSVTARFNAEDLVDKRELVRSGIETSIRNALTGYALTVRAVNITNFRFSSEYSRAIERKQVAQQRALQAKYELQQTQIDAQKAVVQAKAQSEATIVAAKAEAQAMQLKRQQVTPEIIALNAIRKWDGKMPRVMLGGKGTGLMNVLSTDVLQSGGAKGSANR